ncbi:MAG TPA: hypothetical protein VKA07_06620 [Candidatus Sulfotelmatobacter sp.]|nr:hypothetical protein [Candidatus Sulfotelmatobacter sp.]
MSEEIKPANSTSHGNYERRDIGVAGVLYFLLGLAFAGLIVHFIVTGLYSYLEKRSEAQQTPVSPLITNAPVDTRHLPPEYKTDEESTAYEKYLKKNFPAPQLETDEQVELNRDRLREAQILSTYDYIDRQAGTVRIPIDRAMDLIAQRGLPVRGQTAEGPGSASSGKNTKGTKQ